MNPELDKLIDSIKQLRPEDRQKLLAEFTMAAMREGTPYATDEYWNYPFRMDALRILMGMRGNAEASKRLGKQLGFPMPTVKRAAQKAVGLMDREAEASRAPGAESRKVGNQSSGHMTIREVQ